MSGWKYTIFSPRVLDQLCGLDDAECKEILTAFRDYSSGEEPKLSNLCLSILFDAIERETADDKVNFEEMGDFAWKK